MDSGTNQNGLIFFCFGQEFTLQSGLLFLFADCLKEIRSQEYNLWRFSVFLRELSRNVHFSCVAGWFGEQPRQVSPAKEEIFQHYLSI